MPPNFIPLLLLLSWSSFSFKRRPVLLCMDCISSVVLTAGFVIHSQRFLMKLCWWTPSVSMFFLSKLLCFSFSQLLIKSMRIPSPASIIICDNSIRFFIEVKTTLLVPRQLINVPKKVQNNARKPGKQSTDNTFSCMGCVTFSWLVKSCED